MWRVSKVLKGKGLVFKFSSGRQIFYWIFCCYYYYLLSCTYIAQMVCFTIKLFGYDTNTYLVRCVPMIGQRKCKQSIGTQSALSFEGFSSLHLFPQLQSELVTLLRLCPLACGFCVPLLNTHTHLRAGVRPHPLTKKVSPLPQVTGGFVSGKGGSWCPGMEAPGLRSNPFQMGQLSLFCLPHLSPWVNSGKCCAPVRDHDCLTRALKASPGGVG